MNRTKFACAIVTAICATVLAANVSAVEPAARASRGRTDDLRRRVTWRLTSPSTAKEIVSGNGLLFEGSAPIGIGAPTAADFRLEQLRPVRRWIPLVLGGESSPEVVPPDGAARRVLLQVGPPPAHGERKQRAAPRKFDKEQVLHFAKASLHQGAKYRLTWTCRLTEPVQTVTRHCEFRIDGSGDSLPDAKQAADSLPKRYYLVEILYRRREVDGVLFLAQEMLPKLQTRQFDVAAVGFSAEGKSIAPPDPGYARVRQLTASVVRKGWKIKPPLAMRAHTHGVTLTHGRDGCDSLTVSVSDLATEAPLPVVKGVPTFTLFRNALFRVEELTTNYELLRQDQERWKKRIQQIAVEVAKNKDVDDKVRQWCKGLMDDKGDSTKNSSDRSIDPIKPRVVRVAAVSFVPKKLDLKGNAERLERAFREAAKGGAEIIVSPEGALDGYVVNEIIAGKIADKKMNEVAIAIDDPVIQRFQRLARDLKACLVIGFAERIGKDVFNCAVFIDHGGKICGKYHKMQLAEGYHPSWWFNRLGKKSRAFDTPFGRCGILICNDRWNPKLARIPVLDGAQFLVIPSFGSRSKKQDEAVLSRGRENRVPVIEANVGVTLLVDQGKIVAVDRKEEGITFGKITIPPPAKAKPKERDKVEREFLEWRKDEMRRRYEKRTRR